MNIFKTRSMRGSFIRAILLPGIALTLLFTSILTFGILYVTTGKSTFQNLLYITATAFTFFYVFVSIFEARSLYHVYQEGLFAISRRNFESLARGEASISTYPEGDIVELKELNNTLSVLNERWSHSILYSVNVNYDEMEVPFVDKQQHLIAYGYLKERIGNLIHVSSAFTIGLLELFYDLGEERLNEEEKQHLLALANRSFDFVAGRLFAFGEGDRSLLCYLPGIDSMRIVKEKMLGMSDEATVSKRMPAGMTMFPLRAAMVCYPYSAVPDLFADLRYAKRQSGHMTIFLPDRKKTKTNGLGLSEHNGEAAFFSKAILPIRRLSGSNPDKDKKELQGVIESIATYLGTDFYDLVAYERNTSRYYSYLSSEDHPVPTRLLEELISIIDDDNSFYFSSRSSCSLVVARDADELGVTAGFMYALFNGQDCLGVLYFGKRGGNLLLDSYAKSSLIRLGEAISDYFFLAEKESRAQAFQDQAEHILGLSEYMVYKIDDATKKLTYVSPNMRAMFPNAVIGEFCYKGLYGLEHMCPRCPLREFAKMQDVRKAKMQGKVREVELETSLTLNDRKSHERTLLIERLSKGEAVGDIYDKNWLVYSYRTLLQQLENAYLTHSRGYLVLITLDNLEYFLTHEGSEGACFSIRSFVQKIKTKLHTHDVYAYNPSSLALLLPRAGQVELIDACEAIYDISKESMLNDTKEDVFTLTYLTLGYPQGYASAVEFLSHAEEFYRNGGYKPGEDMIYFQDRAITRSASKRTHMLHVIDEVFGTKTASCVYLQPMLTAKDKKLFGAEILLRVEDVQRHKFFMADELSKVAEENGRISLITESLLNFVQELYKEHGASLFALNAFQRIAINVDAAFLRDSELASKVNALYEEQHLGKGFLAFEVPESLITDSFNEAGNAFSNSGVVLVCDQYTGKYVSLEKLKAFGFHEIKLPFGLIKDIDVDPKKFEAVASIVNAAKALGLRTSAVGVENSAQYLALRDLDPDMLLQGYHFYKPLSRSDLIAAVISHNH